MKAMNVLFVCICFFVLADCSPVVQRKNKDIDIECSDEERSRANVCAEKLWFVGRKSRKYPENEPEMQKHCKQTAQLIKCVKDFTDLCGKETQRQLANVMLFTVRVQDKSYCTKTVKRQEMISMSTCANEIREQSSKCMDEFMVALGKSNAYETRLKVPHACCSFHDLKTCIMRSARSVESSVCTDKSMDYLERYINSMSGNTIGLMCNDYEEDSDKCQHLPGLPKGTRYSKANSIIGGFGKLLED